MNSLRYVGLPIKRKEDPRLLRGESTYVDDIKLSGMLYAAILRSPYPHARIVRIDTSKAKKNEGVVAVYTGQELIKDVGPLVVETVLPESKVPKHYPLAVDEVKFVGEPVAVVVAEDIYKARDALEDISVEYEPLPAVLDPEKALGESPKVHREFDDNVCFRWKITVGDVEGSFRIADSIIETRFKIQRLAAIAMEPRGVVAHYDAYNRLLTVWSSTQFPHKLRTWIATSLNWPENRIRVIAPEVGGGFGSKLNHYPEDVIIPYLAFKLNRPIKWVEDRRENLQATTHGRDIIAYVTAAVKRDGELLGLRARLIADLGAYNYVYTQDNPVVAAKMLPGCYKLKNVDLEVVGVFTNKMATDAYRGAGRPEASYIIERTIDMAARSIGMDPAEIRRRNFIPPHEFPYKTPTGIVYDSGNYELALNKALELAKYKDLRAEQVELRKQGKYIGIGISSFVEICNFLYQSATVRVEPTGKVLVFTSTSPTGQGEETSFSQIVADTLGVHIDDVQVIHGDTLAVPYGWGTAGSWTLTSGGNAILKACNQIKEKILNISAKILEAKPEDLEVGEGKIYVKDSPQTNVSFKDVARLAYDQDNIPEGFELGLVATSFYIPQITSPFGTYVAVVEVLPDTGEVKLLKLVLVNDVGKIVNPMLVEGQIKGGALQAIGQALLEEIIYDENGNLLTDTLSDYLIPTAVEVPTILLDKTETPAPNPLGTKGVGELSTIGLTQAIVNAIEDALTPFGVRITETPVTSMRLWRLFISSKNQPHFK